MKLFLIILTFLFTSTTVTETHEIKVAVAANAQFVMKDLIKAFEKEHNITIDLIVGSSGKLSAQIMNGAPYHIFLSANEKYANYIYENKQALETPIVYAEGSAVLWTTGNINLAKGLNTLLSNKVKTIAIASPKNAPYGTLAIDAMKDAGILNTISEKIVYGSSISQVNQYISLHIVDVGITSKSVVHSPAMKGIGKWIDINGYAINQAMVKLAYSKTNETESTQQFYDFLQSNTACDIFVKHGYFIK